ncbi:MAPEG family protein [Octadecabacter sp. 1_MG-2023]|uniref:MAPEG family protein n=1 Tax=unclassified Octadecabacter TaxID=196158 RepID=UPI001C0A3B87|nr:MULTISPECIES: MAPEG family protein [unclassified Octadecabacter]MBU2993224.1 MAPEG family protein [Octadecabacter sp. B2R22]MDO6733322.1 MAPEG family protein [Octadecabacter sp. 1_MG-2023]
MPLIEIIALLAVAQFLYFGYLVGMQRRDSGLKAPAMTGHDGFERAYRVQMNTLELMIAFLPVLLLAGKYWPAWMIAPIGLIYLVGRTLYQQAYMNDPSKRGTGFMLTLGPIAALLVLALLGAVIHLF